MLLNVLTSPSSFALPEHIVGYVPATFSKLIAIEHERVFEYVTR